jgi:hypothetical protein
VPVFPSWEKEHDEVTASISLAQRGIYILACTVPLFNKANVPRIHENLPHLFLRDIVFPGQLLDDLFQPDKGLDLHQWFSRWNSGRGSKSEMCARTQGRGASAEHGKES